MHYVGLNSDLMLVAHSDRQFEVERVLEKTFVVDEVRLVRSELRNEIFTVELFDPITDYYYSNQCWIKSIPEETPLLVFDSYGTYILATNEENLVKKLSRGIPYIISVEYDKDISVVIIKTRLTRIVRVVYDLRIKDEINFPNTGRS